MFKSFIARSAGLLAALCLATGSQAAPVTKNFNFLSAQFTLKAELQYDDAKSTPFGDTSAYTLTIHEFTTTLSNFTLPTLKVAVTPWYDYFVFSGGATQGLDANTDDVFFNADGWQKRGYYTFSQPNVTWTSMSSLSFNNDPYVPPTPTPGTVPEPSSLALVALAGLGLVGARRRRA
ncbi:PEP-CTERM sorting domain-containing protein [Paucibacter sp. DJ1R-11]|uniref:PEP-CTERM sorting domain-containing protein n=1 Tax=Paucibacter sp. DJ1R-11 TaxID=2893556 RepID=UPI0021E3C4C4|nr:PEP-CTERM sorting domain-containing protein [Paucibacter sp. DJ1R-11]MCV2365675.1 PEP-CTERM sorting domain-containing protein [Paucibacter sp. DJ1R-11]